MGRGLVLSDLVSIYIQSSRRPNLCSIVREPKTKTTLVLDGIPDRKTTNQPNARQRKVSISQILLSPPTAVQLVGAVIHTRLLHAIFSCFFCTHIRTGTWLQIIQIPVYATTEQSPNLGPMNSRLQARQKSLNSALDGSRPIHLLYKVK